jgi:hypothetical protein
MYELKKKLESYLRVNLLGPGCRLMEKRIYRAAVSQRLKNTDLSNDVILTRLKWTYITSGHWKFLTTWKSAFFLNQSFDGLIEMSWVGIVVNWPFVIRRLLKIKIWIHLYTWVLSSSFKLTCYRHIHNTVNPVQAIITQQSDDLYTCNSHSEF